MSTFGAISYTGVLTAASSNSKTTYTNAVTIGKAYVGQLDRIIAKSQSPAWLINVAKAPA